MRITMETITTIEEQHDQPGRDYDVQQDGFRITTTDQSIWLGIDNCQSCCENWGYLISEDDPAKFIGAKLIALTLVDTNRTSKKFVSSSDDDDIYDDAAVYLSDGDVMFVDIATDRGVLQFAAYNGHNGYYGHSVTIKSDQLKHEVTL